ncbi:ABC transporter B family member 26, chloroplastic-like isoform X2 [Phragmites australis]|uniref:ABC transporter B family member 26, chloroplastic-like isoform X2 n=1 Tax=Phragmites australis TaxID=29695 RepID=UPI002D78A236|nr:ABC transporter B family member 26, chloroplastic-like isoform X2 [Phragmites australis]
MPLPAAMLLLTAPLGSAPPSLTLTVTPRRVSLQAPRQRRALRPARIRAAVIGGEFGGLGRRRVVAGEFIERLRNVLPGGSWWRLEDGEEAGDDGSRAEGSGTTAVSALRRMWGFVSADRWVVYAGFVSLVCAALAEIAIPHLLAASIFSAQNGGAVFYRNAKLLVVLCLISGVFSGLRSCCFGVANMILVKRTREMLFNSILSQDISFFDEETVGDLTSRLGSDCQQVSRVIGCRCINLSANLILASWNVYNAYLCNIIDNYASSWTESIHHNYNLIDRFQKRAAKFAQECTASANNVAQEVITLVRTVRVYGTEKHEFKRYAKWLDKLYDVSFRQTLAYGGWSISLNYLYHSTQVIGVVIGGLAIMSGKLTAEQLTKFTLYAEWLILSTWWIGDNWSSLMQSVGASEKVFRLMDLLPSKQLTSKGLKLEKLEGRIQYADVSFSYPSRSTVPILERLNLTLNPNEVVAIVGLSGSGKSTLVNLLLRLYEPTNGQVLIDGVPLTELDIRWFRERIGFVGQEPRLFRMDISSNIKYGCPREVSHEEVVWAAKQAYAHDFIMSLPDGYNTIVDDALLSGGQKQRVAIARALLREPSILLLDEATSALDADSEHYVKSVITKVSSDSNTKRTVVIIAHRLSTIQAADRIIVMENGNIVEDGKQHQLIKKDGLYSRLARRQSGDLK